MRMKGSLEMSMGRFLFVIMAGVVVIRVMTGPVGGEINQGLDNAERLAGSSGKISVENAEMLADLARYSRDRAQGCDKVKESTYEHLSDTDYTKNPPCAGLPGTPAANLGNVLPGQDTGDDMEGQWSRIDFNITEPVILKSGERYGSGPESEQFRFLEVSKQGYGEYISKNNCQTITGFTAKWLGTDRSFNIFFKADADMNVRTSVRGDGKRMWELQGSGPSYIYCPATDTDTCSGSACTPTRSPRIMVSKQEGYPSYKNVWENGKVRVKLCPGDEGYVQVNKGSPLQGAGEPGEPWIGDANYYPHLVITEVKSRDSSGNCKSVHPDIDLEVDSDPKVVEDTAAFSMEGLMNSDERVDFIFQRKDASGSWITQNRLNSLDSTKVSVSKPSASAAFEPEEIGLPPGEYRVTVNVYRCESGCSAAISKTERFDIEHYQPSWDDYSISDSGIDYIPVLLIAGDYGNYQDSGSFDMKQVYRKIPAQKQLGVNAEPTESSCVVHINERDWGYMANDDNGNANFLVGTKIDQDGSLPPRSEAVEQDWASISFAEGTKGGYDDTHKDYYDDIEFNSQTWSSGISDQLVMSTADRGNIFKLYGDLVCANPDGERYASWYMCDESMVPESVYEEKGTTYEAYTITVNRDIWSCNPVTGEWVLEEEDADLEPEEITLDYMDQGSFRGGNPFAESESQRAIEMTPADSTEDDFIGWNIGPGPKKVNVTLRFDERGHLMVRAGTTGYINMHSGGDNTVHTNVDGDYRQIANYETGEDYTVSVRRQDGSNTWKLKRGEEVLWETTVDASDFDSIWVVSDEEVSGDDATHPEVVIKDLFVDLN